MLDLKPGHYYHSIWFGEKPGLGGMNYLATLYKEGPKDDASLPWKVNARLRIYKDGKVFGSKDEKTGFQAELKDGSHIGLEKALKNLNDIADKAQITFGISSIEHILIDGDATKFLDTIKKEGWCHTRTVSSEEAEKLTDEDIEAGDDDDDDDFDDDDDEEE